jgi:hypothetical protein
MADADPPPRQQLSCGGMNDFIRCPDYTGNRFSAEVSGGDNYYIPLAADLPVDKAYWHACIDEEATRATYRLGADESPGAANMGTRKAVFPAYRNNQWIDINSSNIEEGPFLFWVAYALGHPTRAQQ